MGKKVEFGLPIIGPEEKQAVLDVLSQPVLVHGPKAVEFEQKFGAYTGAPNVTSVSSCTAGLHLIYFHLGLTKGDEVIVPAQTHNATAHAVELCGAKPVFVDAEIQTGNIDISLVERAITPRTKAISLVHYLGMPVDVPQLMAIGAKHGIPVIEDCALAMGTYLNGKHAGTLGDFGAFSFYPVKHMTTAEGGMVTATKQSDIDAIKRKKAFGVDRTVNERSIPGVYDVTMLGFNYRMSEIHAALGVVQLTRLNGFLEARKKNYAALARGLSQIPEVTLLQTERPGAQCSWYCLSAVLSPKLSAKRADIIDSLKGAGIGTSVYYPHPVPYLKYYKEKYGFKGTEFPNAARLSYDSIAFPVGPHLNESDMATIVEGLKSALTKVK